MVKGLAVSALLVLLLSSASFALITQNQGFLLGNTNGVLAVGPDSGAANTNALTIVQDQLATDRSGHVTSFQGEAGSLVQSAGAQAICGVLGIEQAGQGIAGQFQLHPGGCTSLGFQDQDLTAGLEQHVIGDGFGSALALQNFVGFQTQLTFTMFGASANTQGVGVTLADAFGGSGSGPAMNIIHAGANFGIGQTGMP
jgi:opacity protein-like surface antigen